MNDDTTQTALNVTKDDKVQYDYKNQAWVINGKYVACNHSSIVCDCYGTEHYGEEPDAELYVIGAIK